MYKKEQPQTSIFFTTKCEVFPLGNPETSAHSLLPQWASEGIFRRQLVMLSVVKCTACIINLHPPRGTILCLHLMCLLLTHVNAYMPSVCVLCCLLCTFACVHWAILRYLWPLNNHAFGFECRKAYGCHGLLCRKVYVSYSVLNSTVGE